MTYHRSHAAGFWLVASSSSYFAPNLRKSTSTTLIDQQQDVDLVVQLDDQLLDVGVLDLPPREVVVGRVDEIRTPGEGSLL